MIAEAVPRSGSSLCLPAAELDALIRHAERSYPEECCGILVGSLRGDRTIVSRVEQTENQRRARACDRYEISPKDLLREMRRAREAGEDVVGYYHSHPDSPARPSSTDESTAWPSVSYVIVEVSKGRATEVRSWRRSADGLIEERVVEDVAGENRREGRR